MQQMIYVQGLLNPSFVSLLSPLRFRKCIFRKRYLIQQFDVHVVASSPLSETDMMLVDSKLGLLPSEVGVRRTDLNVL